MRMEDAQSVTAPIGRSVTTVVGAFLSMREQIVNLMSGVYRLSRIFPGHAADLSNSLTYRACNRACLQHFVGFGSNYVQTIRLRQCSICLLQGEGETATWEQADMIADERRQTSSSNLSVQSECRRSSKGASGDQAFAWERMPECLVTFRGAGELQC